MAANSAATDRHEGRALVSRLGALQDFGELVGFAHPHAVDCQEDVAGS